MQRSGHYFAHPSTPGFRVPALTLLVLLCDLENLLTSTYTGACSVIFLGDLSLFILPGSVFNNASILKSPLYGFAYHYFINGVFLRISNFK